MDDQTDLCGFRYSRYAYKILEARNPRVPAWSVCWELFSVLSSFWIHYTFYGALKMELTQDNEYMCPKSHLKKIRAWELKNKLNNDPEVKMVSATTHIPEELKMAIKNARVSLSGILRESLYLALIYEIVEIPGVEDPKKLFDGEFHPKFKPFQVFIDMLRERGILQTPKEDDGDWGEAL